MIDFNKDVMPLKNRFDRLALRVLQDGVEAQDVTQETLIRLWRRIDTIQSAAEAEALGVAICRNLSLDSLRRAGRDHEQIDGRTDLSSEVGSVESPYDDLMRQERCQILRDRINALPERQRTTLQLRDIEGYSYKEIAAMMQVSEEQVKVTLFRARQALKQLFAKQNDYGL